MSKQFDDLAKDLASGLSRRKVILRIGAGLGAAILGLMTGGSAHGQGTAAPAPAEPAPTDDDEGYGDQCDAYCNGCDDLGMNHGQCVSYCVHQLQDGEELPACAVKPPPAE